MDKRGRRLMCHGMVLFVLGLVTGFAESAFANPRMGLAAHLEGVMNGIFLLAVGAGWQQLALGARWRTGAFWALLYATYANWAATLFAAVFGTGALSPLLAPGRHAMAWQEGVVTGLFMSLGPLLVATCATLAWGFARPTEAVPIASSARSPV